MTRMQIIVDEDDQVLGTLVVATNRATNGAGNGSASNAPTSYGAFAKPGQRILEVSVDDSLSTLAPAELHAALAKQHLAK